MEPQDIVAEAQALVLRADIRPVLARLSAPDALPHASLQDVRAAIAARFDPDTPPPLALVASPFVRDVISAFRVYYRDAMLGDRVGAEAALVRALDSLLSGRVRTMAQAAPLIEAALEVRGMEATVDRVEPLWNLRVWRHTRREEHTVALPEGPVQVLLHHADDFLELGWMHFATLGARYSGGWLREGDAERRRMFRVRQPSDRANSPGFKRFLVHEGQHMSDLRALPAMAEWELEYRAKLAEIATDAQPVAVARRLLRVAADDPSSPHARGAWQLALSLADVVHGDRGAARPDMLLPEEPDLLAAAAAGLLRADTARRLA